MPRRPICSCKTDYDPTLSLVDKVKDISRLLVIRRLQLRIDRELKKVGIKDRDRT
jgi:hypothetical protein